MYKYTIDAYTLDAFGKPHDVIQLVVTAADRDSAIAEAQGIENRGEYKIVRVEKLAGNFNTAMGLDPAKLGADKTVKTLRKG